MICNGFAQPCVIIDVLTDVWVEDVTKVSVKAFAIKVRSNVGIITLCGVCDDVTIDVESVEVLTDVNVTVLTSL